MSIIIPDEIVQATHMSEAELKLEIGVLLFQKEKLTLAQAARLAGMNRLQFQHVLSSRDIAIHYDVEDIEEELNTLHERGHI